MRLGDDLSDKSGFYGLGNRVFGHNVNLFGFIDLTHRVGGHGMGSKG